MFRDGARPLSALARHFIAGVLAHSAGLAALAAPTVTSYKRLVVGESLSGTSWAPAYVAFVRSALTGGITDSHDTATVLPIHIFFLLYLWYANTAINNPIPRSPASAP